MGFRFASTIGFIAALVVSESSRASEAEDFARSSCEASMPLVAKLYSELYEGGADDILKPTTPKGIGPALIQLQLAFRTDPDLQPISREDFLNLSLRLCEVTDQSYYELRVQSGR